MITYECPVLPFDVLHSPEHSMHVLLDTWCTCRSLPYLMHVQLVTRSLAAWYLIHLLHVIHARAAWYPIHVTRAISACSLIHELHLLMHVLLDTWCTDCTRYLIPDVRTAWTAWYLMHALNVTHARAAWFLKHGLNITHPCTCCLIPDARTALYPCTFYLYLMMRTAYYPSMYVLLNTWCTDCISPIHARAA
jgi:hypothetical protein